MRTTGTNGTQEMPDTATPSAPADGVKVFSSDIAGRSMLSTIDSGGIPSPLQASWAHKQVGMWSIIQGSASVGTLGMSAPAVTFGTTTARASTSTTFYSASTRVAVVSGAAATNIAIMRGSSSSPLLWRLRGFTVVIRFGISDAVLVGTAGMLAGIQNGSTSTDITPSAQLNTIAVGVNSGDTTLQLYAAGSVAQPRVSLGANFPANTVSTDLYELVLHAKPGGTTVGYRLVRLNTGHETSGTISGAGLPDSDTWLSPQLFRGNGGTAAAVAFDLAKMYVETEY